MGELFEVLCDKEIEALKKEKTVSPRKSCVSKAQTQSHAQVLSSEAKTEVFLKRESGFC
jgi:hypothetical protein